MKHPLDHQQKPHPRIALQVHPPRGELGFLALIYQSQGGLPYRDACVLMLFQIIAQGLQLPRQLLYRCLSEF